MLSYEMEAETTPVNGLNEDYGQDVKVMKKKYSSLKEITPEVLENLRKGDHEAFNAVYLHHLQSVIDFLNVLLRDVEDAREIAQTVFMNIWENREKIDPSKSIKGYIYTYAKFNAFDLLSRRKVEDKYVNAQQHVSIALDDSPDEIVISKETELLIKIALERMPEQRKKVFIMSRFEGLKDDEIAERLEISKRTVQSHIYVALKDIREVIAMFILLFASHQ